MLILGRKIGQKIEIGEGITITVAQLKAGSVRLGIDAPENVRIVRGELRELESDDNSNSL